MAENKFLRPLPVGERLAKEEEFFNNFFMMSYSGLSKLLFSPALFYHHYVLGQREDTQDINMIIGKLIHCLLLNPEHFDEEFIVTPFNVPSDNPKQVLLRMRDHVKELVSEDSTVSTELVAHTGAVLDILKDMNLYQSLKTDVQRFDKIMTPANEAYYNFLMKSSGKSIVDIEAYDFAKEVVDKIKSNPQIMELMGYFGDSFNGVKQFNEIELTDFPEGSPFGLRGFLDNVVIDPINKVIRVNDLKKSAKTLTQFTESIDYYKYWLQGAIYYSLANAFYCNQPQYKDYKVEFRFIVIDNHMQIAPIRVSDETMIEWCLRAHEALNEAKYHFAERNFDLPYVCLKNKEITI